METMTAPASQNHRRSLRGIAAIVAIAAAFAVAFYAVNGLVRDPEVVPRIEIRNQTDDIIDVLVRSSSSGSLLPLAIVEPQRRAVADEVFDQGDRWTFVVKVSDRTVSRIRLTREELVRAGWTVTVGATPDPTAGGDARA